ncbi:MAG TPA: hypothetical protein VEV41_04395 [Terriglobales bacterium]|nr:hypothetical protein [Terriglobales bacterium]
MFERLRPFFKPPSRPCRVNVDGLAYDVMTDPAATDPATLAVRDGKNQSADLVRVMLKLVKPGDVVLDLGANIGTVALAAAAIGCHDDARARARTVTRKLSPPTSGNSPEVDAKHYMKAVPEETKVAALGLDDAIRETIGKLAATAGNGVN